MERIVQGTGHLCFTAISLFCSWFLALTRFRAFETVLSSSRKASTCKSFFKNYGLQGNGQKRKPAASAVRMYIHQLRCLGKFCPADVDCQQRTVSLSFCKSLDSSPTAVCS